MTLRRKFFNAEAAASSPVSPPPSGTDTAAGALHDLLAASLHRHSTPAAAAAAAAAAPSPESPVAPGNYMNLPPVPPAADETTGGGTLQRRKRQQTTAAKKQHLHNNPFGTLIRRSKQQQQQQQHDMKRSLSAEKMLETSTAGGDSSLTVDPPAAVRPKSLVHPAPPPSHEESPPVAAAPPSSSSTASRQPPVDQQLVEALIRQAEHCLLRGLPSCREEAAAAENIDYNYMMVALSINEIASIYNKQTTTMASVDKPPPPKPPRTRLLLEGGGAVFNTAASVSYTGGGGGRGRRTADPVRAEQFIDPGKPPPKPRRRRSREGGGAAELRDMHTPSHKMPRFLSKPSLYNTLPKRIKLPKRRSHKQHTHDVIDSHGLEEEEPAPAGVDRIPTYTSSQSSLDADPDDDSPAARRRRSAAKSSLSCESSIDDEAAAATHRHLDTGGGGAGSAHHKRSYSAKKAASSQVGRSTSCRESRDHFLRGLGRQLTKQRSCGDLSSSASSPTTPPPPPPPFKLTSSCDSVSAGGANSVSALDPLSDPGGRPNILHFQVRHRIYSHFGFARSLEDLTCDSANETSSEGGGGGGMGMHELSYSGGGGGGSRPRSSVDDMDDSALSLHQPAAGPSDHTHDPGLEKLFLVALHVGLQRQESGGLVPVQLTSYPLQLTIDRAECPFYDNVPAFCFPDAASLSSAAAPSSFELEETYSFVFTDERGRRMFGYCQRVQLPPAAGGQTSRLAVPGLPTVFCLISLHGCFDVFHSICDHLKTLKRDSDVFSYLRTLYETPVPPPGGSVKVSVFDYEREKQKVMQLSRSSRDVRHEHVNLQCLPLHLEAKNIVKVFASLLLERRVWLWSSKLSVLSSCALAFHALLYPFTWEHVFVPMVPLELGEDLALCPSSYLIGTLVHPDSRPDPQHFDNVLIVDLDHKGVFRKSIGDERSILPDRQYKALKKLMFDRKEIQKRQTVDRSTTLTNDSIAECFLHFFVEMLFSHDKFIYQAGPTDRTPAIHKEKFIRSRSKESRQFLSHFLDTSMFQRYLDTRHALAPDSRFERRYHEYSAIRAETARRRGSSSLFRFSHKISGQKQPPPPQPRGESGLDGGGADLPTAS